MSFRGCDSIRGNLLSVEWYADVFAASRLFGRRLPRLASKPRNDRSFRGRVGDPPLQGVAIGQIIKKGNSIYDNRIAQTVGTTPITLHRSISAFSVSHVRDLLHYDDKAKVGLCQAKSAFYSTFPPLTVSRNRQPSISAALRHMSMRPRKMSKYSYMEQMLSSTCRFREIVCS